MSRAAVSDSIKIEIIFPGKPGNVFTIFQFSKEIINPEFERILIARKESNPGFSPEGIG